MRQAFDFLRFCRDYNVPTLVSGHKHCQPGWIQTPCPFCVGNPGWHLGFNISGGNMNCWRCGAHSLYTWLRSILGSHQATKEAQEAYQLRPSTRADGETLRKTLPSSLSLPAGSEPLGDRHRKYLEDRRFDPDRLVALYDLKGTGPSGPYKYRIIAPIYLKHQLVSFQGRDITGKSEMKYKACPKAFELMDHHDTLYSLDLATRSECVVVEGITDAWRLGPGAVATFGIKYKPAQVKRLAAFRRVFVLFDTDPVKGKAESLIKAEQLAAGLASLGVDVELLSLESGDPGEMDQSEADHLMKDLGLI